MRINAVDRLGDVTFNEGGVMVGDAGKRCTVSSQISEYAFHMIMNKSFRCVFDGCL